MTSTPLFDSGQVITYSPTLLLLATQTTPTIELLLTLIGHLRSTNFSLPPTLKIRKAALKTTWDLSSFGTRPSKIDQNSIASANPQSLLQLSILFPVPPCLEVVTMGKFWCGISEQNQCLCSDLAFQPTPISIPFAVYLSSERKLLTILSPFPTMECFARGTSNSSTNLQKWAVWVLCALWGRQLRLRLPQDWIAPLCDRKTRSLQKLPRYSKKQRKKSSTKSTFHAQVSQQEMPTIITLVLWMECSIRDRFTTRETRKWRSLMNMTDLSAASQSITPQNSTSSIIWFLQAHMIGQ